jgi:hypothetical protein
MAVSSRSPTWTFHWAIGKAARARTCCWPSNDKDESGRRRAHDAGVDTAARKAREVPRTIETAMIAPAQKDIELDRLGLVLVSGESWRWRVKRS